MTIGERIRSIRQAKGITQIELASATGISKQNLYKYETNIISNIPSDKIEAISRYLDVSPAIIMGWDNHADGKPAKAIPHGFSPMPEMYKVPLIGSIACGEPILAEEHIDGYVGVPKNIRADFALLCKGDSMINAGIRDGDVVYIRKQETVENGQIAAVIVEDMETEATLKRFYFENGVVTLSPENNRYPPKTFIGSDIERIRIVGLAVGFTHLYEWA